MNMPSRSDIFAPGLLRDKVAFLTGGTSGINFAIAKRFARAGAKIAIVGRDADKASSASSEITLDGGLVMGLSADVRDYAAIEAAIQKVYAAWGEIDVVVAGAAGNFVAPAMGMSSGGFRAVVDIDLVGTFNTVRAAFPAMRKPGSTVIAMSAGHSSMPIAGQSHVCAAKAGIDMLIRSLSIEWGPHGVRCLTIAPGPVEETEGMRRLAPNGDSSLKRLLSSIPLGRQAAVNEIADLALFLVSGAADYINGTVISIDGGLKNLGSQTFGEMLLESVG